MLHVVLEGAQTAATADEPTAPAMPAFGWQLDRCTGRRRYDLPSQQLGPRGARHHTGRCT